jgi:hypothetical protein
MSGRSDVIISGDADLLILDCFRTIPIVSPATFLPDVRGRPHNGSAARNRPHLADPGGKNFYRWIAGTNRPRGLAFA